MHTGISSVPFKGMGSAAKKREIKRAAQECRAIVRDLYSPQLTSRIRFLQNPNGQGDIIAPLDFLILEFSSFGGKSMRRLKWWHWVLIVIVVTFAVEWISTGKSPLKGFVDGYNAGSK
jgi:hypothetical protein